MHDAEELAAQIERLDTVVTAVLGTANHSEEELRDTIQTYRATAAPLASDPDCEDLARRLIDRLSIDVERGVAVYAEEFKPWLEDKQRDIDWVRWKSYRQYLLNAKWPGPVVENLDELTNQILEFAGDPTEPGPWARRGLVLGDVQSGKTASYLALFNKAADAGYRLIIVLAGHTESLRQQTQRRVDEGFTGHLPSTQNVAATQREIGVGLLNKQVANVQSMTTMTSDFSTSSQLAVNITVDPKSSAPYVFVVKKNVTKNKHGHLSGILPSLSKWLDGQPKTAGKIDIPVLVLDDESDYASVNTRNVDDPTAVNDAIRSILSQFSRSSYVAFTATPFANIFIDYANTDDLFPRDFIYALEAPSNYIGPERVFGRSDDKNTTNVIDLEDIEDVIPLKHKPGFQVERLPDSLIEAVRAFFIANAIRDLRGQKDARAMLVNVSRYKNVQKQVYDLLQAEVLAIKNAIVAYSVTYAQGEPNDQLAAIQQTYEDLYTDCGFDWETILPALDPAVIDIRIKLFNSDTDRRLEEDHVTWDRPNRLIAVGGDVLSRGLTLEGLTVSYFYRGVGASDTLLQMARWFGYRDGYHDICRLWMDPTVADDFRIIAESVEELRRDLRSMFELRLTPKDFGLAVRKHPGTLLVTARNKMKDTESVAAVISVLGRRIETVKLPTDLEDLRSNYAALEEFIDDINVSEYDNGETFRGYPWWQGVPKARVAEFLGAFKAHSTAEIFSQAALSKFVLGAERFPTWDVVLVNGPKSEIKDTIGKIRKVEFIPPSRTLETGGIPGHEELRLGGKSARLAGADDLANLLGKEAADSIRAEFKLKEPKSNIREEEFYRHLQRPALLIWALKPAKDKATNGAVTEPKKAEKQKRIREAADIVKEAGVPVVALKLAFPGGSARDTSGDVEYIINSVAIKTWFPTFEDVSDDESDEIDA